MTDEAFALSPISARAALPSEADYDAIREAFMETSRGRWFLGEYAKRNRNADTTMVLDAVARIEETLAAQKKPLRDPLFDEALASLRTALSQAREAAKAALDDLALEENLLPVRKGVRVIREIAWRLREIGADGRICDLIDSQVSAIEGAAGKLAPAGLAGALSEAFDHLEGKIAAFDAGDATDSAPPAAEASPDELHEAPASAVPVATAETEALAEISETIETAATAQESEADPAVTDEAAATAAVEAAGEAADAFDANDEAMLNMVALEMAAPDTDAAYEPPLEEMSDDEMPERQAPAAEAAVLQMSQAQTSASAKTASISADDIEITFVTDASEPPAEPVSAAPAPLQVAPEPALKAELKPEPKSEAEPSLGSSLLANGIVSRPRTSKPDPLAPIRRMSQTEKIAFFS
jgi:hypothetical protein